jgi:group II intron reverse transcriptase/maturase
VTTEAFEAQLDEELSRLQQELSDWTYQPQAVRRVEILKDAGRGGVRLLGIPTVRDRVVQATLKALLEPLFDPHFSSHSYGFRPGRNQSQALQAAQQIVRGGKGYVVDIDLEKFFDRIHPDRLIARLGQRLSDPRILRLIGMTLRSGVMAHGVVQPVVEGAPQGSPLSPLLSNIVLDELDQELEQRGLAFCRFADDCNIFVRTRAAAERVMTSTSRFIEKQLRLKVNRTKSQVAPTERVKFLGMTIVDGTLAISRKAMNAAMAQVKILTPRGSHRKLEETIKTLNRWYEGWSAYFAQTHYPSQLKRIEAHLRRRLRSRLIDHHRGPRVLFDKLVKRGVPPQHAGFVLRSHHGRWAMSNRLPITRAYPNVWFIDTLGQFIRSTAIRPHWFELHRWIKLP